MAEFPEKAKTGPKQRITYAMFVEKANELGWVVLSGEKEYRNTKSTIRVKLPTGETREVSWNRLQQNHTGPKMTGKGFIKKSDDEVRKVFEDRGLMLVEPFEYIDGQTPIPYIGRPSARLVICLRFTFTTRKRCSGSRHTAYAM